jgi:hypothetical protein
MDQNQLAPYVRQDSFPLFAHGEGSLISEFRALLQKIMTERVKFDAPFADAIYRETSGHPYLTVNLLTHFFEWLIEQKRPANQLNLNSGDFDRFTASCLTASLMATRPEYGQFLKYASEATGEDGRIGTPWLHSIYVLLKNIATFNPTEFWCSRDRFNSMVSDLRKSSGISCAPEELLRTGTLSNFFMLRDEYVMPKIRLLARIAAASTSSVGW